MSRGKKKKVRKIEQGQNVHIDRIRAIYPDDSEVFWVEGNVLIKPKGTELEEIEND